MFNQCQSLKKSVSVKLRNANFFLKLSAKARNFTPPPFRLTCRAQPGGDRSTCHLSQQGNNGAVLEAD